MTRRSSILAASSSLAVASSFAITLPVAAQAAPAEPDRSVYWPHMMGWDGAWYGGGPIMMILWIGLLVAIVVLLVRAFSGPSRGTTAHQAPPGRTALDILRERLARGEIDKAEFEDKRRALSE